MKTMKLFTVRVLIAVALIIAFVAPVVIAQGGRTVAPALPFPGEPQPLGAASGGGIGALSAGTSGIAGGANWLLGQQVSSGGFPWTVGGGVYANTQGPSGQGPLKAYQHDGDSAYLTSAVDTGDYLVPSYPVTYSDGDPRFATHNPLFLEDLSLVTGDSTYADFVQTWFWDKLTAGTYGESNDMDAADFGAAVVNGRAGQGIVALSPWDLSATAIGAHVAGETAIRDALMGAIEDGLEATTAGDTYDVIGLAGAVWASAVTGVDLDPTTGAYASDDSTADLAATLAGMTLTANDGAWLWGSNADPDDPTNGDTQTTAYAIMALNAHDRSTYLGQIARGAAFIRSLQSSGQFLAWPGASPSASGGVEVHAEALTALVVVAPSTVYVDDDWAMGVNWGDDPDGAGPAIAFGYGAFATITDGIDGVGNSTVYVAPGTYNETVTIFKDNLTVLGDPSSRPAITGGLKLDTDLTGLTFKNFAVTGNAASNSIVRMYGAITDLTVDNCVFDGENVSGRLGFSGGQLEGDVTITNSEFKNILGWALFESRSGSGGDGSAMDTVTFANNHIHDSNGSVVFRGLSTDRTDVVNVYGNTWENIGGANGELGQHWAALEVNRTVEVNIHDNTVNNVSLGQWGEGQAFQFWDIDTLKVYDNNVTNNSQGIFIYGDAGGGLGGPFAIPGGFIRCNHIVNNQQYGLDVDSAATGGPLNAEDNWWGCSAGPGNAGCDTVNGNVDYDPWATSTPPCEPTAITLPSSSFTAQAGAGGVNVAWETGTEVDNAGFNLYRAMTQDGPWTKVNEALIAAQGDAVSGARYSFADAPGYGTFYYRLEAVDYYGASTLHGPVKVTVARPFRRPLYRPRLPEF